MHKFWPYRPQTNLAKHLLSCLSVNTLILQILEFRYNKSSSISLISLFFYFLFLSTIAVRRKSQSRRRRSQTLQLRPASRRSTPITTLWRRRPPPPPSQMAPPFSPPLRWPGNWHVRRPSVHPVHIMSCHSTSSPLRRRSTTNQMGWGTEETGSATAASSSRTWTYQCLWTFQTIANQTSPGRSPWGTCSHAAAASALMFSWVMLELGVSSCLNGLERPRLDWAWVWLCLFPILTSLVQSNIVWCNLVSLLWSPLAEWRTQMALRTAFSKLLCSGPGPYTWTNIELKVFVKLKMLNY